MPKAYQALAGFSELDPILQLAPVFDGEAKPVSYSIVDGDFGIHNDNYSIDSNGFLRVLVAPASAIQNFIRYRITTDHDACQWVEDFVQLYWTDTDFTPTVLRDINSSDSTFLNIDSLNQEVAHISNMGSMPSNPEFQLRATWENEDPLYTSSLFDIDSLGVIRVADYYALQEDKQYRFTLRVIDLNTDGVYYTPICLGPFKFDTLGATTQQSASACVSTTPIPTTTAEPMSCANLQPLYPNFLTAEELEFYEDNCITDIEPPSYAFHYELCTTDFLEARSYTIEMSGLDSVINTPQVISFDEGESVKTLSLFGNVVELEMTRDATTMTLQITMANAEVVVSTNLHYREGLEDPLLSIFSVDVTGYSAPLTYTVRSNQVFKMSDDHGLWIRNNGACYGRLGIVLGDNPDTFAEPNGGEFATKSECLGE
jgi:hypothetical protein